MNLARAERVTERVGALIAIFRRVGHLAYAYAVEHYKHYAVKAIRFTHQSFSSSDSSCDMKIMTRERRLEKNSSP
jgi:hypothetical protein